MKTKTIVLAFLLALGGLAGVIWIRDLAKPCCYAPRASCISNLKQLEDAKFIWAIERGKATNDTPTMADIAAYLTGIPSCPVGGTYTLGRLCENPKCSVKGHQLP